MARSSYFRSYFFIPILAVAAAVIGYLTPEFTAQMARAADLVSVFFRYIDVAPAALHEIVSAVIDGATVMGRSSMFMFVSASCLTLFGLFRFAARSEVRGSPASIAIAG